MTGLVAVPLGVAGFVTRRNHAMETIQASALRTELSPAPFSSQKGFTATTDSPSPATPVHSFDLFPFIIVCLSQLHTPPVPVSPHIGWSTRFPSPSLIVVGRILPPLHQQHAPWNQFPSLPPLHWTDCSMNFAIIHTQTKLPYVIQGPCHGFHLGFHLAFNHNNPLESALGNMAAALANLQVINNYLHTEVQLGRVQAPFFNLLSPVSM